MRSPRHACSDFQSALPLPEPGPASGQHVGLGDHGRARGAGDLGGGVGGAVVDHDDLVDEPPPPVGASRPGARGPRARCRRRVAASLRAGRHTEIEYPSAAFRLDEIGEIHGVSLRGTARADSAPSAPAILRLI